MRSNLRLSRVVLSVILLSIFYTLHGCTGNVKQQNYDLTSPDGRVNVSFSVHDGVAQYRIGRDSQTLLLDSKMGVELSDFVFDKNLRIIGASRTKSIEDNYEMRYGKSKVNAYHANEIAFTLMNERSQQLLIRFRASNNGVAFRYEFSGNESRAQTVEKEFTTFKLPSESKAWLQPMAVAQTGWNNTNPSYEEHYQMGISIDQASPSSAGWVFPALFKSRGQWLAITEAGMTGNYHASRLQATSPNGEYKIGYPMEAEVSMGGNLKAVDKLPFHSPWRIIAIGSLGELVESTLGTDLAEPAISEMPFVKPGLASWSWALLKDDSVNFETQKEFIDYAADMGWPYTLVDADWDQRIGEDKIKKLADYAKSKNIGLMLWYNSSGDWNTTPLTPKSKLLTSPSRRDEFAKLKAWGIKGIKVDFFAGDSQSMMRYYNELAKDAADFDLMLNYHGSSLPRGLSRTYPNLMTMESVHGFEMITFMQTSADKAPSHMTMLPFTRNLFDPMDFTPTTFGEIPNIERRTTNGFELALPVLFLSGLQHIAETPANMTKVPNYVKDAMRNIPTLWDESRLIQGYPGKEVVIARRKGATWYIAGINGEPISKSWRFDLSFLEPKSGVLITDGEKPKQFKRVEISTSEQVNVDIKAYGGFLMTIDTVNSVL